MVARPRFCPECGVKADEKGGFCCGCGHALAALTDRGSTSGQAARSTTSPTTVESARSATFDWPLLFGGGWLSMGSPSLRKQRGSGLAIATTLVFAASLAALACWYAQYFYNRADIDAAMLQGIARGAVVAGALSVLGNAPLARRAPRPSRTGAASALGLFLAPLTAAMISTGFVGRADETIAAARRAANPGPTQQEQAALKTRDDALFGTPRRSISTSGRTAPETGLPSR